MFFSFTRFDLLSQPRVPLVQLFDVVVAAHVEDLPDERRRVDGELIPEVLDDVRAQLGVLGAAVYFVEGLITRGYLVAQQGAFGHLLEVDDLFV